MSCALLRYSYMSIAKCLFFSNLYSPGLWSEVSSGALNDDENNRIYRFRIPKFSLSQTLSSEPLWEWSMIIKMFFFFSFCSFSFDVREFDSGCGEKEEEEEIDGRRKHTFENIYLFSWWERRNNISNFFIGLCQQNILTKYDRFVCRIDEIFYFEKKKKKKKRRVMFFYLLLFEERRREEQRRRQDWTFVRFDFFFSCLFMSMCM